MEPSARQEPATQDSDAQTRSTGIVLEVGTETIAPDIAERLAMKVVERVLGREWRVERFARSATPEVAREFVVRPRRGRSVAVGEAWDLVRELRRDRDVASAEPSFVTVGIEPPSDARGRWLTADERRRVDDREDAEIERGAPDPAWSLRAVRANEAWAALAGAGHSRPGEGVRIGHPDTGYTEHPVIWPSTATTQVRARDGFDFVDGDSDATDPLEAGPGWFPGHGTATASVILGTGRASGRISAASVVGIAPHADLVPIRVSRSVVHFGFEAVARAIDHAVGEHCHVISLSLGGPFGPSYLHRAIRRAVDAGVIVVAAAGNVWPWVVYPARFDEVIAVAATNVSSLPWVLSTSGHDVDLSAPGEDVLVARALGDQPVEMSSGSSFATALVAGAAALWLQRHGRDRLLGRFGAGTLASVFRELLVTSGVATPHRWDAGQYGSGILDIAALLDAPLPETPPARGFAVARTVPSRSSEAIARLHSYVPRVSDVVLRSRLGRMFGVSASVVSHAVADHADELTFLFATSPTWRASFGRHGEVSALDRVRPRGANGLDPFLEVAPDGVVSRALQAAMREGAERGSPRRRR